MWMGIDWSCPTLLNVEIEKQQLPPSIYTYMRIYIYCYVHIYISVHICMCICIHLYVYVHVYIYLLTPPKISLHFSDFHAPKSQIETIRVESEPRRERKRETIIQ